MSEEQPSNRETSEIKRQKGIARGEAGEKRARSLLIGFFERVSPEASLVARFTDKGVDLEARRLRSDLDNDRRAFHFQVKTQTSSRLFRVTEDNFETWQELSLVRNEPVFLLFYSDEDTPKEDVRFLNWRTWAIGNAATHAVFAGGGAKGFGINVDAKFAPVGAGMQTFSAALVEELNRAKGVPGTPFRVVQGSQALPVDLNFLLQNLETAAHLWLPEALRKELWAGTGPDAVTLQFLRAWRGIEPVGLSLREFVKTLQSTCSPTSKSFERQQFGLFVDAMIRFQRPETRASVTLPRVSARTIACWRCFGAYFPEALHLFTHFAQHGSYNDQLFSRVILPVLVVASGTTAVATVDHVTETLRRLRGEFTGIYSLEGYMLKREAVRGILETGCANKSEEREAIDFMHQYSSEGWELRYLNGYGGGWEGTGAIQKAEQKLTNGTLRDVNAREFYAWMRDRLPRMLGSAPETR